MAAIASCVQRPDVRRVARDVVRRPLAVVEIRPVVVDERRRPLGSSQRRTGDRAGERPRGNRSRGGSRSDVAELAVRADPSPEAGRCRDQAARVGDHEVAAGPKDADELAERLLEVRHMASAIAQTTRSTESSCSGSRAVPPRGTRPRAPCRERARASRASVDADHRVAERCEVRGVAPGAAGRVEATPTGRPSRISRTTGCSMSRSWFPGSS